VTWSGTVVRSGNRIVLRSSQEQWISLSRSGDTLYVSLQHRATGVGALLKITGFDVRRHGRERRDGDWFPWGWKR